MQMLHPNFLQRNKYEKKTTLQEKNKILQTYKNLYENGNSLIAYTYDSIGGNENARERPIQQSICGKGRSPDAYQSTEV